MSRQMKRRLGVGGVVAAMAAVGVWCFVAATLPPPEVRAGAASGGSPAVAAVGTVEPPAEPVVPTDQQTYNGLNAELETLRHQVDAAVDATAAGGDPTQLDSVLGRYDSLIERTRRLAEAPGTSAGVAASSWRLLSDLYTRQALYAQANEAYGQYLDRLKEHRGAKVAAATVRAAVLRAINKFDYSAARDKVELYVNAFTDDAKESARALILLTEIAYKQGSYVEAVQFADLILTQYATSQHVAEALRRKAQAAYRQRDFAAAEAAADELVRRFPKTKYPAYVLALKGGMQLTQEQPLQAAAFFSLLLERYPTSTYREWAIKKLAEAREQAERELLNRPLLEGREKLNWEQMLAREKERLRAAWDQVAQAEAQAGRVAQ